jgi:hypothetical protein
VKADRKAERARKRAARKAYDRNHAQLKRQQGFQAILLASQLKRARKQARRDVA